MRIVLISLLMTCFFSQLLGQISFIKPSKLYPILTVSDVYEINVLNSINKKIKGTVIFTLNSDRNEIIFRSTINNVELEPGLNMNLSKSAQPGLIEWGTSQNSELLRSNNVLQQGRFNICIDFHATSAEILHASQCFSIFITDYSTLKLVSPCNKCEITTPNPLFTWTSIFNQSLSNNFLIRICEVLSNQSPEESQMVNIPIIERKSLTEQHFLYESGLPDLKTGTLYSWQVYLLQNDQISKVSEVWSFYLTKEVLDELNTSVRMASLEKNQHVYFYDDEIKFSYNNRFNMGQIEVTIDDINNGSKTLFKSVIELQNSNVNIISLLVNDIKQLKRGNNYLLSFYDIRRQPYYIYFSIK